ncbi:hypothetical protein LY78DRAFT_161361 [Colletotrichum sublineola]|nr:hypothetical protein LY78DRAFT_161361 [Colletotrichum sublineola]
MLANPFSNLVNLLHPRRRRASLPLTSYAHPILELRLTGWRTLQGNVGVLHEPHVPSPPPFSNHVLCALRKKGRANSPMDRLLNKSKSPYLTAPFPSLPGVRADGRGGPVRRHPKRQKVI